MKHTDEKALRLVLDDRVNITWNTEGAATGLVDGYTDTYQVSYSPEAELCTCPAGVHHRRCSHVTALRLAVVAEYRKEKVSG